MRLNLRELLGWLALSHALLSACSAQEQEAEQAAARAPTASADELSAIRSGVQDFVAAFNNQDAQAIAALWTEQGEYIDEAGRRFMGRDEIEQGYEFFDKAGDLKIRVMVDSLRLLSDAVAVEDGRAVVEPPPTGAPGVSRYVVVHVKVDGQWKMASVRDQWIETSSTHEHVADLDWLIGVWIAEEYGARSESVCRWIANKSFVERRYTTTHADGTQTSGVQLIGWNPLDGHVQSWNFSSDGGHAVGVWTPVPEGWTAEMSGVNGDGRLTTSINMLTRLDDHAYVWQSVERTAGGVALPDTGEIILRRQSAER